MKKKKVMIVDDEENLVELVKVLLEREGYEVIAIAHKGETLRELEDL